jgi:DUF2075 family protein
VSSQAERLKPLAIHVKSKINPIHWFLNDRDDVRSSWFLEDVVTEFQVQGLELDWVCVTWDADLRYKPEQSKDAESGEKNLLGEWSHHSFKGNKWQNIHSKERQEYQLNAYRVLLTRARQGMIIVVPEGNPEDHTRNSKFYDSTFEYLKGIGLEVV